MITNDMNTNENNGHGEKYSRLKEIVLAALLSSKTLEEAAQKAGISVSTLRRWFNKPDFRKDYDEEKRHVLEMATRDLSGAASDAIRFLWNLTTSPFGDVRNHVVAANAILNMYNKEMQRHDTQRRLSALEQKVANEQPENTEQLIEESKCCENEVREVDAADTPDSLSERQNLATEPVVTELRMQMNADGRKKGPDGNDAEDLNHESTVSAFSFLKRRVV